MDVGAAGDANMNSFARARAGPSGPPAHPQSIHIPAPDSPHVQQPAPSARSPSPPSPAPPWPLVPRNRRESGRVRIRPARFDRELLRLSRVRILPGANPAGCESCRVRIAVVVCPPALPPVPRPARGWRPAPARPRPAAGVDTLARSRRSQGDFGTPLTHIAPQGLERIFSRAN